MHTFEFTRPADAAGAIAARREGDDGSTGRRDSFHRRRHDVGGPDEAARRDAAASGGYQPPAVERDRGVAGRRFESRRHGAQFGARLRRDRSARLLRIVAGDSGRRVGPDSQHGDDGRKPAAADAVRLLPRSGDALQQARARQRLSGDHRAQSDACDSRHERALHRHKSVRHVRRAGGARGHDSCTACQRRTRRPDSPTSICCPATRRTAKP